jgi:5-methylcytosine-specific restriction protein A
MIFFWTGKNYRDDERDGLLDYTLNQNNHLISEVEVGDHVWAFTRREDGAYVLAADLVVAGRNPNTRADEGYKYGKYNVRGDRKVSRYFDVEKAPDVGVLLRQLFPPSKSSKKKDFPIGQSFQGERGVKPLSPEDENLLQGFSLKCPVRPIG